MKHKKKKLIFLKKMTVFKEIIVAFFVQIKLDTYVYVMRKRLCEKFHMKINDFL